MLFQQVITWPKIQFITTKFFMWTWYADAYLILVEFYFASEDTIIG